MLFLLQCIMQFIGNSFAKFDIFLFFCISCLFYSIHRVYCLRQGITSPISDLTERLLLEERDPSATPQDILYEVPPFDEVRYLCRQF